MDFAWIVLAVVGVLAVAVFVTAYVCFRMAFYSKDRVIGEEFLFPDGELYEPYHPQMLAFMKETRSAKHEDVEIKSFDGLTLRGKYYEYQKGAPIELLMNGYRGSAERDLCGGMQRCFALGRNVLIVDQRAHGRSDGNIISFGIVERKDCLSWTNFIVEKFGKDVKILIGGISMGAATVMMASDLDLPKNVVGVLADCGYSSPKEIIQKSIQEMGLPVKIFYPILRLGGKIFGKFDLEETSPVQALKNCKVPVLFFHGEEDDIVPIEMSKACFDACSAPKKLYTFEKAGHGVCFLVDREKYLQGFREFVEDFKVFEEK